jgi:hypothetical protein
MKMMEAETGKEGNNYIEYKLTSKAKNFVNSREGKVANSNEHFWVVKYQSHGEQKGYMHIGISPPDLSRLRKEEWRSSFPGLSL